MARPRKDGVDSDFAVQLRQANIIKAGWLSKQGGKWKNWKNRWFILTNVYLAYMESETSSEAKGIILLRDVMGVLDAPLAADGMYQFKIVTQGRVYLCKHADTKVIQNWMEAIKRTKQGKTISSKKKTRVKEDRQQRLEREAREREEKRAARKKREKEEAMHKTKPMEAPVEAPRGPRPTAAQIRAYQQQQQAILWEQQQRMQMYLQFQQMQMASGIQPPQWGEPSGFDTKQAYPEGPKQQQQQPSSFHEQEFDGVWDEQGQEIGDEVEIVGKTLPVDVQGEFSTPHTLHSEVATMFLDPGT